MPSGTSGTHAANTALRGEASRHGDACACSIAGRRHNMHAELIHHPCLLLYGRAYSHRASTAAPVDFRYTRGTIDLHQPQATSMLFLVNRNCTTHSCLRLIFNLK